MKNYANQFTVVLDANVLFPFLKRDILLTCAQEGLYRPYWTEQINEEWSHKAVEKGVISQAQADNIKQLMSEHFPEAEITGHEPLMSGLVLPDPGDRHVLAAAIRISADMIVTDNIKDFPADVIERFEIEACTADDFLANTIDLFKADAVRAIRRARLQCKNPEIGRGDYQRLMLARGLVNTVAEIKPYVDDL